ncbi:MAG: molybdopterin synthase sulfur carrier subunit [Nitrospinae bacterium CG11_big_fil_rev_8_21_14_0_20_56_8]|nr:MAG: molybdopterin synthase sulfur carrier subunit [Nitrospinae bacterium CG11_big_fil_rev_8_21_14_0_20_56_8]
MITVKYFASLKGIAGKEEDRFDLGGETTLKKLGEAVAKTSPVLGEMVRDRKIMISVNMDVAGDDTIIHDGDEVALLPPFSGGSF